MAGPTPPQRGLLGRILQIPQNLLRAVRRATVVEPLEIPREALRVIREPSLVSPQELAQAAQREATRLRIEGLAEATTYGQYADREYRLERYAEYLGVSMAEADTVLFREWYAILREQEILERMGREDKSPTGRYARALEVLGYREHGSPYRPGKSPRTRKARH